MSGDYGLLPFPENNGDDDGDDVQYIDHFSLGTASTTVRFRNAKVHIYGDAEDQFLVEDRRQVSEEDDDDKKKKKKQRHVLTVKRIQSPAFGLQILRATYTLVAFLVFGFLFVFCFQIILNLVFNMLADRQHNDRFAIVGAILSLPTFLYGMASIMCLGWTFVCETWGGNKLFRNLFDMPVAATEWICFAVFLGVPAVTVTVTLFARQNNWWEITASTWVLCVLAFMVGFAVLVVSYEVNVYSKMLRIIIREDESSSSSWVSPRIQLLLHSVYLAHVYYFSGLRHEWYLVNGDDEPPKGGYSNSENYSPARTSTGLFSRFTQSTWQCAFFEKLAPPARAYHVVEVREILPFLTKENWSLETLFCRNRYSQMTSVTGGQGALRPVQLKSAMVCQILGSIMIVLIVIAVMSWMRMGTKLMLLLSATSIVFCIAPIVNSSLLIYKNLLLQGQRNNSMGSVGVDNAASPGEEDPEQVALMSAAPPTYGKNNSSTSKKHDKDDTHDTMMQVWETVRVTKPRPWLCYTLFSAEMVFFFLWPMISLFTHGNMPIGVVFIFLGIFSLLRLNFNAASILTELGPLSDIDIHWSQWVDSSIMRRIARGETEESCKLQEKSRISDVIGKVSRGPSVIRWAVGYGFAVTLVFLAAYSAATSEYETTDYKVKGVTMAPGFYYPPRNASNAEGNLPYQTCKLTKGFSLPGVDTVMMEDYAFFATMSYAGPKEAQGLLDEWFGEGKVQDEYKLVDQYRDRTESIGGVSYKLFSFHDYPEYGVVSIRGSEMPMDWMVNIKLWSCAALLQVLRETMPFGKAWTPMFHKFAYFADWLQSSNLRKETYYGKTTKFVNDVLSGKIGGGKYKNIHVTGVSLGGGLAIITGAQTGASTVAISGPNAMISRETFDPPLEVEQINTRVLNVIPDRDPIARLDDHGRLTQRIECRAPSYSLFGCHSMWRSLCEFSYQCGSKGRPINCWCVSKYGYPKPVQSGDTTWDEACANA